MESVNLGGSSSLTRRDNLPSKTISLLDSNTFSGHNLLKPRVNQVTGCCATKVIINLSTSLVIPDYTKFYDGSPATFQPSYYQLDDGSLIAPPFVEDLTGGNVNLFVLGLLLAIFARNITVSGDYLRRAKVKSKSLFYILFASQLLAPISLLPMIASYFNQGIDCTPVVIVSYLSSIVSLAFLITGILGVKAYKCLENSRFVLAVLTLMQLASFGASIKDMTMARGERRLSGSCVRTAGDPTCVLIFVVIQFVESLFICCCFLYAYWRSRNSRRAKGRISLPASLAESPISPVTDEKTEGEKQRPMKRGWWDYVPNPQLSPRTQQATTKQPQPLHQAVRSKLSGLLSQRKNKNLPAAIKSKEKRESFASDAGKLIPRQSLATSAHYIVRPNSPTPSSFSRMSRLIPNMVLFRKVMTDELLYTAFITATCVIVAVLVIIGVNFKNNLTVTGWVGSNWAIISLLTIHSFGLVVHRHERDPHLQRCPDTSRHQHDSRTARAKRRASSPQIRFRNDLPRNHQEDPFADVHGLRGNGGSWDSSIVSPTEPLSTSFPADRRESASSQATSNSSYLSTDRPLSSTDGELKSPFSSPWLVDGQSRDNLIEETDSESTINGHGSQ